LTLFGALGFDTASGPAFAGWLLGVWAFALAFAAYLEPPLRRALARLGPRAEAAPEAYGSFDKRRPLLDGIV
jgi:hypothetical protein